MEGLLRKGKLKALVMDDLWDVAESDLAEKTATRFQVRGYTVSVTLNYQQSL